MELYKVGSKGEVVRQIQKALKLYPDGIYGPNTKEAVKAFQRENGLKVDGIVGPATLARLIPARFKKSKRTITDIIIHCTDTKAGQNYTVEQCRADHIKRGWSDIGYHYLIYRDGSIHNGRDVDIAGAHCEGHNTHSIGVCYVGGKGGDTRTLAQKAALINLLTDLKKLYPTARIVGHRDYDTKGKTCPSFDAKTEYRGI